MKKKLLSMAVSIVMAVSVVPMTAFGIDELTVIGPGVEDKGNIIEIVTPGDYEISGNSVSKGIRITANQGVVNLKLSNVIIDLGDVEDTVEPVMALEIIGNSDVNISLEGQNYFKSSGNHSALIKKNSSENKLVVEGEGVLRLINGLYEEDLRVEVNISPTGKVPPCKVYSSIIMNFKMIMRWSTPEGHDDLSLLF